MGECSLSKQGEFTEFYAETRRLVVEVNTLLILIPRKIVLTLML